MQLWLPWILRPILVSPLLLVIRFYEEKMEMKMDILIDIKAEMETEGKEIVAREWASESVNIQFRANVWLNGSRWEFSPQSVFIFSPVNLFIYCHPPPPPSSNRNNFLFGFFMASLYFVSLFKICFTPVILVNILMARFAFSIRQRATTTVRLIHFNSKFNPIAIDK